VRKALLFLVLALALVGAGCGGSSSADGCTDVDVPPAREDGGQTAPTERLDPEKTYDLVFKTNCGSFTVRLDLEKAPATSASLVALAKAGFYDDMIFHRIVPGFVIQGGDPTQTGSGGPGYQTVDPPPAGSTYAEGVVAMAKTGAEPAGTSGSQFFVVSGPNAASLPPDYAIVGTVTSGMDTVKRIDGFGDPNDPSGAPTRPVVIESVTVEEQ